MVPVTCTYSSGLVVTCGLCTYRYFPIHGSTGRAVSRFVLRVLVELTQRPGRHKPSAPHCKIDRGCLLREVVEGVDRPQRDRAVAPPDHVDLDQLTTDVGTFSDHW